MTALKLGLAYLLVSALCVSAAPAAPLSSSSANNIASQSSAPFKSSAPTSTFSTSTPKPSSVTVSSSLVQSQSAGAASASSSSGVLSSSQCSSGPYDWDSLNTCAFPINIPVNNGGQLPLDKFGKPSTEPTPALWFVLNMDEYDKLCCIPCTQADSAPQSDGCALFFVPAGL